MRTSTRVPSPFPSSGGRHLGSPTAGVLLTRRLARPVVPCLRCYSEGGCGPHGMIRERSCRSAGRVGMGRWQCGV
jgi:hypothetical protein